MLGLVLQQRAATETPGLVLLNDRGATESFALLVSALFQGDAAGTKNHRERAHSNTVAALSEDKFSTV